MTGRRGGRGGGERGGGGGGGSLLIPLHVRRDRGRPHPGHHLQEVGHAGRAAQLPALQHEGAHAVSVRPGRAGHHLVRGHGVPADAGLALADAAVAAVVLADVRELDNAAQEDGRPEEAAGDAVGVGEEGGVQGWVAGPAAGRVGRLQQGEQGGGGEVDHVARVDGGAAEEGGQAGGGLCRRERVDAAALPGGARGGGKGEQVGQGGGG